MPVKNYLASVRGGHASFWTIAREDFFAAYEQKSTTQLDPDDLILWSAAGLQLSNDGLLTSPSYTTTTNVCHTREDDACRRLVWILVKSTSSLAVRSRVDWHDTWKGLRSSLLAWHQSLPASFAPYASLARREPDSGGDHIGWKACFPQLFFNLSMCAAALQLYHFAQVLLLINWPMDMDKEGIERLRMIRQVSQESEYHGRQICGIALGLDNCPEIRDQMVLPLYLAGICLEGNEDLAAVVKLLREIQVQSGHATAERVKRLISASGWNHS